MSRRPASAHPSTRAAHQFQHVPNGAYANRHYVALRMGATQAFLADAVRPLLTDLANAIARSRPADVRAFAVKHFRSGGRPMTPSTPVAADAALPEYQRFFDEAGLRAMLSDLAKAMCRAHPRPTNLPAFAADFIASYTTAAPNRPASAGSRRAASAASSRSGGPPRPPPPVSRAAPPPTAPAAEPPPSSADVDAASAGASGTAAADGDAAGAGTASAAADDRLNMGDEVLCRFGGRGKWYAGKIGGVLDGADGTVSYTVNYSDGDVDTNVKPEWVKLWIKAKIGVR